MTNALEYLAELGKYLPTIEPPKVRPSLKTRIYITVFVGLLYLLLSHIYVVGLINDFPKIHFSGVQNQAYSTILLLIGANLGTLTTLGVSPIVTASILLMLLTGSKIIEIDLNDEKQRRIFHNAQRTLAFIFCVIEAISFTLGSVNYGRLILAEPVQLTLPLVIIQVILGGIIIILLDELVSKYGIGSGVSLFIFIGVVQSVFIFALLPLSFPEQGIEKPVGALPKFLSYLSEGILDFFVISTTLIPLITIIVLFLVSMYLWMVRVEIPVTHISFKGFGTKIPINLMYTNVIPVIFVMALFNMLSMFHNPHSNDPFNVFYEYCILGPQGLIGYFQYYHQDLGLWLLHVLTFGIFIIIMCVIFSFFWVYSVGMDPKSMAEQIQEIGFQVSGFRRDTRSLERILNRYIPYVTFLSAVLTGIIVIIAETFIGAWVGTGIFLAAGIAYNYYEILKREKELEGLSFLRDMIKV